MDKFMEAEDYEYIREGYYFSATGANNWYYVFLTIHENHVVVEVRNESSTIHNDHLPLKSGDKNEYGADGDLLFSIDIWAKYFFPTFNEDNNQFYHGSNVEGDTGCMEGMFEVFKFAYDLALKESGIKPY